jgi:hypothetical protein
MITRRDFLKTTALGLSALTFSENAEAVYMGPCQKRDEFVNSISYSKDAFKIPSEFKVSDLKDGVKKVTLNPYHCDLKDVSDKKRLGIEKAYAEYYPSSGNTPILIFPALGGVSSIERSFADHYRKKGLPVVIINFPKDYTDLDASMGEINSPEDIEYLTNAFNYMYVKGMEWTSRVVDWVEERKELNSKKIGGIGFSLGGIMLSSFLGLDNRISVATPTLCGGEFETIVSFSKEPGIEKKRKELLSKIDKDQEWLETSLRGKFSYDPLDHAKHITEEGNHIRMYLVEDDGYVPTETGMRLAVEMGCALTKEQRAFAKNKKYKLPDLNGEWVSNTSSRELTILKNKEDGSRLYRALLSLPGLRKYKDPHITTGLANRNRVKKESVDFFKEKLT